MNCGVSGCWSWPEVGLKIDGMQKWSTFANSVPFMEETPDTACGGSGILSHPIYSPINAVKQAINTVCPNRMGARTTMVIYSSTILAKMCGTKCLFPELLQYSLTPPFPPMQCWPTRRQAFPYEQHCMGGGGESRIWPKERWFPCEKLIDGRGSAFCKLVPHNFGQDCSSLLYLVSRQIFA